MSTITTAQVRAYIAKRQEDVIIVRKAREEGEEPITRPVSAGEINRELTALKRMFSLAQKDGKLLHRPPSPCCGRTTSGWAFLSEKRSKPCAVTCRRSCSR